MSIRTALVAASLAVAVSAQQLGTNTPEVHPLFPTQECTVSGGCVTKNTSIVLDSNYRWTHTVDGYDNCKPGGLNATLCPDAETCAKNCALEGADYPSYGIVTKGDSLTLNLFVNKSGEMTKSSPRVYLLDQTGNYTMLKLLDREVSFDVDMSKLPCGTNGAVYFSEMHANGGKSELNPAGANYGTGYCDAQCPTSEFINGEVSSCGSVIISQQTSS
jgi:cellulose 1,4-beta-cellobiosidase